MKNTIYQFLLLLRLRLLSHHIRIFFNFFLIFFDAEEERGGALEAPAVWLDCDSAFRRVAFLLLTFLFRGAGGLIFGSQKRLEGNTSRGEDI